MRITKWYCLFFFSFFLTKSQFCVTVICFGTQPVKRTCTICSFFSGIEDLQICRALLESKHWDLEATAREHLNLPTGEPPLQRPEVMPSAPPEAPNARHIMRPPHHNDNNPRPLIPMGHTVFTWAVYLITLPFRLTYRTVFGVFDFFGSVFYKTMTVWQPKVLK